MKKLILTTILFAAAGMAVQAIAQVSIGKETPENASVLLDFGTEPKGIILPTVSSAPGAVEGTFVVNSTSGSVQVLDAEGWKNLSAEGEMVPHDFTNSGEDIGEGVIIGAETTDKPGVLVLESTTQALVLPKVASPHTAILNPIAGTIVYDTDADAIAVYDGGNWSYWK